jgi:glycosyltransferase involved in cell wall biosynthesis
VEVIEWDEALASRQFSRLTSMLKPGYVAYYAAVRRWIADSLAHGRRFTIAQQFSPIALRYPSPLAEFPIPYVIGPLGGSLETPAGFSEECRSSAWYTQLRKLDRFRLRRDPLLRRTYARADAVLGVAPYVGDLLRHARPRRFEVMSELGVSALAPVRNRKTEGKRLNLVHVGRAVRTKGLRDSIRAIARLPADVQIHLDVAGQGEELPICRAEARRLGVSERITFHGQISRGAVEQLYARGDLFLFPSFREPSGSVVFEALRHGLPVITTDRGGPGFVIDDTCGVTVPAIDPVQLAGDLATTITRIARDEALRARLGAGARERVARIGLWDSKIRWLLALYDEILNPTHPSQIREAC